MKALVTGASRGIGRAVAEALLKTGAHVALAVRDAVSVQALLGPAAGSGSGVACALVTDLCDPGQLEALVPRAVVALAGLDVLVNCAGSVRYTRIAQLSRAELQAHLDLNFLAPFVLARSAALHMAERGRGGAIVNVASTLGLRPAAQTAAYSAAKAALISLTQSLAIEFAPDKVRVNAVAPGVIDTDMVRTLRDPEAQQGSSEQQTAALEAQLATLRALHLLKRLGTAAEVAEAVLFLVRAEFVTGTVLVADGGLLLQA